MSAGLLVAAALLAGVVSCSSPCCLPLLPGYVADVSGGHGAWRAGQTLAAAGLFTLGFGVTFTALGASASWLGGLLLRGAGLLVGTVGLLTVMSAEPRVLARERRLLALHRIPRGSGAGFAVPLGAVVALRQAGEARRRWPTNDAVHRRRRDPAWPPLGRDDRHLTSRRHRHLPGVQVP